MRLIMAADWNSWNRLRALGSDLIVDPPRPSETRRGLAFCIGKSQSHDQAWINILDEQPGFDIISPSSI